MKHRTRYALALTLVATTLCAGRLFASDQKTGSDTKITEKLVTRLTRSFSHAVARSPIIVQRRMTMPVVQPVFDVSTDRNYCIALAPFESNLPPPAV